MTPAGGCARLAQGCKGGRDAPGGDPGDRAAVRFGAARYDELYRPEGPIFFAGEHLSYVQFWQEGTALSSHAAMKALQARVQEKALTERAARRAA